MALYADHVLPRLVDRACASRAFRSWRRRAAAGLSGTVIEIGFGSGLNLPAYPDSVTRLLVVEPAALARRLAEERIAAVPFPVEQVGLRGEAIDLPSGTCDGALCTFTLCTIPGVDAALAEIRRVLRPGGPFHFLEHGLAPTDRMAAWQHRLDPLQGRLAGGCHLTRDPVALVEGAGFVVDEAESGYVGGTSPWSWMTLGLAHAPAEGAA